MDEQLHDEIYNNLAAQIVGKIGMLKGKVKPMINEAAKEFDVSYNDAASIFREIYRDNVPEAVAPETSYDEAIHRYIREHVPDTDKIEGKDDWLAKFNEEIAKGVGCSLQTVRRVTHRYKKWATADGISIHRVMLNMKE